jgi:adenylylsulfate kinase-like enzyme
VPLTSVLWVSGAPGVGKSTVGWALYQRLIARRYRVGYVDIDQLGMVTPSPSSDPDCHRLKLRNLLGVVETFRAHGAEQVIVSGIVDPDRGTGRAFSSDARLALTLVRLTCTAEELTRRYLGRGSTPDRLDELLDSAATLDRNGIGQPIETTAKSPSEVVDALAALIRPHREDEPPAPLRTATISPPSRYPRVLLLTGTTAVGKSTIGWHVFQALAAGGTTTAFADIDQLAFTHPGPCSAIKIANLASVTKGFRAVGADVVVAVVRTSNGEAIEYGRVLGEPAVIVAHLDAQPDDVIARIAHRASGDGPRLAGDLLLGASPAEQEIAAARAIAEAERARQQRARDVISIDTSGRTARHVAAELVGFVGSLGSPTT